MEYLLRTFFFRRFELGTAPPRVDSRASTEEVHICNFPAKNTQYHLRRILICCIILLYHLRRRPGALHRRRLGAMRLKNCFLLVRCFLVVKVLWFLPKVIESKKFRQSPFQNSKKPSAALFSAPPVCRVRYKAKRYLVSKNYPRPPVWHVFSRSPPFRAIVEKG